jgi:uncharacterized protein YndB with AHSA1/START domain
MTTTRIIQYARASRTSVYRACLDARAVAQWLVPDGMRSQVHHFDSREGGTFRVSLTYNSPNEQGKTTGNTDTFHGRFVELVPNERIVKTLEFETDHPELQGTMTVTISLRDADGGTQIEYLHENVPEAIPPEANELGTRMALGKLAALAEQAEAEGG